MFDNDFLVIDRVEIYFNIKYSLKLLLKIYPFEFIIDFIHLPI